MILMCFVKIEQRLWWWLLQLQRQAEAEAPPQKGHVELTFWSLCGRHD